MAETHWVDRFTAPVAPRWTLKRQRARLASDMLRHYEGAATGRRTSGWKTPNTDANAALSPGIEKLRNAARDLVRNNPYAESAVRTICDHTVGWGIVAKPKNSAKATELWNAWANSTVCDADGRHDFAGLQKLVMSAVVTDGEVIVRRRIRRPEDGLRIPMQLQVLEADYLDTTKDTTGFLSGRNRIVGGVEFDAIGRRIAYHLFDEHPGSQTTAFTQSTRIPAESVLHVFLSKRPGQVRAPSWFSPVLLRFKDFDEFEDATLMKAKIAACLAVITTDVDGIPSPIGDATGGEDRMLQPGLIMNAAAGRTVEVVQPPSSGDYKEYSELSLRAIATGMGVTYEDFTGDYTNLPFSAARMSRIRHQARVEDWRWRLLVPQFCDPVWAWVMQLAGILGVGDVPAPGWTGSPMPMIDPASEGLAYQRNIRAGIQTLSESLRERGYNPSEVLAEMKTDNELLDKLGLILDSDPRRMTQAGQAQAPLTEEEKKDDAAAARTHFEVVTGRRGGAQ